MISILLFIKYNIDLSNFNYNKIKYIILLEITNIYVTKIKSVNLNKNLIQIPIFKKFRS
jgi:hypothetical protein